jgi:ZIP family zinc transporter
MLELLIAASATALATGIGAVPVFLLGERAAAIRPALLGVAAGVMTVAAIAGLLLPALDEGSAIEVAGGFTVGVGFLLAARWWLGPRAGARRAAGSTTALLVFAVLFVHSLPEGFAIGTAYASSTEGLALFVVIAIAIQNIPEGTSVAIPMAAAHYTAARQFWAAVASSLPQPLGAAVAYLLVEQIASLLPISFAFAAGAMLSLVAVELLPDAIGRRPRHAVAGALAGAAVMVALSAAIGV